jgi:hypothetical protein
MSKRMSDRARVKAATAIVMIGWRLTQARAGLPIEPPFVPPPPVINKPPPVVTPPPPIHEPPPPVHRTPEPATLVLGLIGLGVAGFAARRKRAD